MATGAFYTNLHCNIVYHSRTRFVGRNEALRAKFCNMQHVEATFASSLYLHCCLSDRRIACEAEQKCSD